MSPQTIYVDGRNITLTISGDGLDRDLSGFKIIPQGDACALSAGAPTLGTLITNDSVSSPTNTSVTVTAMSLTPQSVNTMGASPFRLCISYDASSAFTEYYGFTGVNGTGGNINIVPMTLAIVLPNATTQWSSGSFNYTVQWLSSDGISIVKIELVENNGTAVVLTYANSASTNSC